VLSGCKPATFPGQFRQHATFPGQFRHPLAAGLLLVAGRCPIYSVAAQCWPPPSEIGPPYLDLTDFGLDHIGHALVLVELEGNRWWLVLGNEREARYSASGW
jgi:hypothetical protein